MQITDTFIQAFWIVAESSVKIVIPVLSIWLIFKMIKSTVLGGK